MLAAGLSDNGNTENVHNGEAIVDDEVVYSVEHQLKSLPIATTTLGRHETVSTVCGLAFYNCQRDLRLELQCGMKQITIYVRFGRE